MYAWNEFSINQECVRVFRHPRRPGPHCRQIFAPDLPAQRARARAWAHAFVCMRVCVCACGACGRARALEGGLQRVGVRGAGRVGVRGAGLDPGRSLLFRPRARRRGPRSVALRVRASCVCARVRLSGQRTGSARSLRGPASAARRTIDPRAPTRRAARRSMKAGWPGNGSTSRPGPGPGLLFACASPPSPAPRRHGLVKSAS